MKPNHTIVRTSLGLAMLLSACGTRITTASPPSTRALPEPWTPTPPRLGTATPPLLPREPTATSAQTPTRLPGGGSPGAPTATLLLPGRDPEDYGVTYGHPAWSPDGRWIAFTRSQDHDFDLLLMDSSCAGRFEECREDWVEGLRFQWSSPVALTWSADGSRLGLLYYDLVNDVAGMALIKPGAGADLQVVQSVVGVDEASGETVWTADDISLSPDGRRVLLAVSSRTDRPSGIYEVSSDGRNPRLIRQDAVEPIFSPDGRRIAFLALGPDENTPPMWAVMDSDGNLIDLVADTTTYTAYQYETRATWSPDSHYLAVEAGFPLDPRDERGTPPVTEMFVVTADGQFVRRLIEFGGGPQPYNEEPYWSPDGSYVAFISHDECGGQPVQCWPGGENSIFVVRPDGGGLKQVVAPSFVHLVGWTPDGRQLLVEMESIDAQGQSQFGVFMVPVGDPA